MLLTCKQCKGISKTDFNTFDKCNYRQVFDTIAVKIKATKRDRVDAMWQFSFFVLCSAGKLHRDVYSQIYFDVSPGNGRQAKRQNKFENIHLCVIYRQNTKQRKFSLASLAYHAR